MRIYNLWPNDRLRQDAIKAFIPQEKYQNNKQLAAISHIVKMYNSGKPEIVMGFKTNFTIKSIEANPIYLNLTFALLGLIVGALSTVLILTN